MTNFKFDPPVIIGALCTDLEEVPLKLSRAFSKLRPRVAFLPFKVMPRHLKNVVACMRLMDIHGLVVLGEHRRAIVRHLRHLDSHARSCGCVDLIVRGENGFIGTCLSCKESCGRHKKALKASKKRCLCQERPMGQFYHSLIKVLTQGLDLT